MWLLSLRLDFLHLPLRLPPVCLPLHLLPPQRRAAAGAQQEDHGKTCATPPTTGVRAPTTSSTSPQELCEIEVCFLHIQLVGTNVRLRKCTEHLDVDFVSWRSPAKSES